MKHFGALEFRVSFSLLCFVAVAALIHRVTRLDGERHPSSSGRLVKESTTVTAHAFKTLISYSATSNNPTSSHSYSTSMEHDLVPQLERILQDSSPNGTVPSPSALCSSLNELLTNQMTCTCDRYDKTDVSVSCVALNELCNSDQTWCALSNIQYIVDRQARSRSMLSCTNVTRLQDGDEPLNTCVQLIPASNGDFSNISQCNAVLNDQTCTCTTNPTCNASNVSSAANTSAVLTHIGINCCNVQDGAVASCMAVGPNGAVLVLYDSVSDGQCPNSAAPAGLRQTIVGWRVAVTNGLLVAMYMVVGGWAV